MKKMMTLLLSAFIASEIALASETKPEGVVSAIKNDVRALRNPSAQPKQSSKYKQVKFNGSFYDSYPLTRQSPLFKGDIITTLPKSHVKLILKDGDVVILGPESQYELIEGTQPKGQQDPNPDLNIKLWYGKVRSIIKKQSDGKPRVQIRSPNAVVGVRGTDFYTEYDILSRKTKTAPLHGQIEVTSITTTSKKDSSGKEVKLEVVSTKKVVVDEGKESSVESSKDQKTEEPTDPKIIQPTTISNAVFITEFKHDPGKAIEQESASEAKVPEEDYKKMEALAESTVKENTQHLQLEENQDALSASARKYETVIRKIQKESPPWNERIFNWMKNSL